MILKTSARRGLFSDPLDETQLVSEPMLTNCIGETALLMPKCVCKKANNAKFLIPGPTLWCQGTCFDLERNIFYRPKGL